MKIIDGVQVIPLRKIPDERGMVMHMMKADSPAFEKFGEIYFSVINPGVVKAWHLHKEMSLNYAVPHGMIKLVLYDDRQNSPTKGEFNEFFIGDDNYCLVHIPKLIWNGFKGISVFPSIVANLATHPHSPDEISRTDPTDSPTIPYNWARKDG